MQKEVLKCRLRQLEQQVVESYEGWKNKLPVLQDERAILLKNCKFIREYLFYPSVCSHCCHLFLT